MASGMKMVKGKPYHIMRMVDDILFVCNNCNYSISVNNYFGLCSKRTLAAFAILAHCNKHEQKATAESPQPASSHQWT